MEEEQERVTAEYDALTKELAAQLLTTVAACMINNVAPTVEEAINEVDHVARTATADALGPLRSAVASLTEQVAAVRALAESASLGSGPAAVEKAIAEEAYAEQDADDLGAEGHAHERAVVDDAG